MLSILTKVKGGMIPILTPIMKDGETTLTLGMALKPIRLVLTKHLVNLLTKIGPTSYQNKSLKMDDGFQILETTLKQVQERQMATDIIVSNLRAQMQNRLPSQPYPNPKENFSAITIRSGKKFQKPRKSREVELELEVKGAELKLDTDSNQATKEIGQKKREPYKPIPPFPSRFRSPTSKVNEANQEILETLKKVEINIPLLDLSLIHI